MNMIRAKDVPIVITFLAILVGLGGTFLGLQALFNPSSAIGYIDGSELISVSWAGRNAGLGVALLLAVIMRHAAGYTVAFGASIFREISDVMANTSYGDGFPVEFAIFMLIEIVAFVICLRAAWPQTAASVSNE